MNNTVHPHKIFHIYPDVSLMNESIQCHEECLYVHIDEL